MPMYSYQCDVCCTVKALLRKIEDRDKPLECLCSGHMVRLLDAANFTMNRRGWDSGKARNEGE